MNRIDTVAIAIQANKGNLLLKDAIHIIREYCLEKNKKEENIKALIEALMKYPLYIGEFAKIALLYYSKKYHLNKVYNKEGKIIVIF